MGHVLRVVRPYTSLYLVLVLPCFNRGQYDLRCVTILHNHVAITLLQLGYHHISLETGCLLR